MKLTTKHKKIIVITVVSTITAYIIFKIIQRSVVRKRLEKQLVDFTNFSFHTVFNESVWNQIEPTISDPTARSIAEQVNAARGYFSDDRTAVLSELSKMKNIGDASLVAHMYRNRYSRSLAEDLESMFANRPADLSRLVVIINGLNSN